MEIKPTTAPLTPRQEAAGQPAADPSLAQSGTVTTTAGVSALPEDTLEISAKARLVLNKETILPLASRGTTLVEAADITTPDISEVGCK